MGNTREEKDLQKQTQNKKMVIGTYISIITLNMNDSHSDRCEVISHCGFDLHFSDD